jgi:hypothetical protein
MGISGKSIFAGVSTTPSPVKMRDDEINPAILSLGFREWEPCDRLNVMEVLVVYIFWFH